jgi:hypothetical protein
MDIASLCISTDLDSKTNALNDLWPGWKDSLPPEMALVGKLKRHSLTKVQPMLGYTRTVI